MLAVDRVSMLGCTTSEAERITMKLPQQFVVTVLRIGELLQTLAEPRTPSDPDPDAARPLPSSLTITPRSASYAAVSHRPALCATLLGCRAATATWCIFIFIVPGSQAWNELQDAVGDQLGPSYTHTCRRLDNIPLIRQTSFMYLGIKVCGSLPFSSCDVCCYSWTRFLLPPHVRSHGGHQRCPLLPPCRSSCPRAVLSKAQAA